MCEDGSLFHFKKHKGLLKQKLNTQIYYNTDDIVFDEYQQFRQYKGKAKSVSQVSVRSWTRLESDSINQAEYDADHSLPPSVNVQMCQHLEVLHPFLPTFSWCGSQVKGRDNFILAFTFNFVRGGAVG